MVGRRVLVLTAAAMIAFAGNSLLCRAALRDTAIDAATFTWVRIASGALVLALLARPRANAALAHGTWKSAAALFGYAALFSFAYLWLPTGTGALLLFGAVQATMIGYGLSQGERMTSRQLLGLTVAVAGLVVLLAPGITAPHPVGAALMIGAGIAWGIYSLRGKRSAGDPVNVTAGNFLRAVPMALALGLAALTNASFDLIGVAYAAASGGLASGVGYAIWYSALRGLPATSAASVQLSVPAIAALGGIVLLGEPLTLRFVVACAAILGGITLVILAKRRG